MNNGNNNVTAAIYIRWSTDDQGTGTTLHEQRETCLRWAGERGLTVAAAYIFIDDGVSGVKLDRPALSRMNRLIQQGTITLVIIYKLDRLARRPYVAYKLIEEWTGRAAMVSVTESHVDTTTTGGQLGLGIAVVFASHERNTIRDRTLSGKRRRAAEGRNPGMRPPYGYHIVDKRFIIVADEAAIVRRIYDEYVNNGRTDGQLDRMLNASGIRTKKGGPWHISAVQRILQNPAYKGTLIYRDITAEDAFPIIIDPIMWDRAQSLRQQKAKLHPRRLASESPYILSGRLVCSNCGRPMNGRLSRDGKYDNRYYLCTGYIQFRDCESFSVRQTTLEQAVVAHLVPLLDEAELHSRTTARIGTAMDMVTQEVAALETRLAEIDHELARVRRDYRRALIDALTFNGLNAEIEADRVALSDSLTAKKSELISADSDSRVVKEVRQAASVLHAWDRLSYAQRKQVIHLLTQRIEWDYHTETVTVRTAI